MKNKDIFRRLVYLEGGTKKWQAMPHSPSVDSERWLQHILPADADAPNIENTRKNENFWVIVGITMLLLTVLGGRLFSLEILSGKANLSTVEGNYIHEVPIRAPRGVIYDSQGTALVKNVPNYDLSLTPSNLPLNPGDRSKDLESIAKVSGVSLDDIKKMITKDGEHSIQPVLIAKNLTQEQSILISSQIADLPGIKVDVNPIREYLDGGLLSHTLGYVGRISAEELDKHNGYLLTDYIGKTGLESSYESYLRGKMGEERYEVDSTGREKNVLGTVDPVPGGNLKLSIDNGLEQQMVAALKTQMDKAKVKKATAVAINPSNGQILAIANLPTYDDNLFSKGISNADYNTLLNDPDKPLINRAISGEYPSGSTIKPFIASAALEEGNITESTTVNSTGGITVGSFFFPDWKAGGHGVTNVLSAIANSVNTFFYAIGGGYGDIKGLGPEKIKEYLDKFGYDKPTGIDIAGESTGSIPDPEWKMRVFNEPWYLGDTYHMSIGQGDVLVTPLQMANATTAIANGGTLYQPTIVSSVVDNNGKVIKTNDPKVIRSNIVSASTLDVVTRGMRQTVTSGSGRLLNTLSKPVYAKTGTAQYGPNNSLEHAWFICFTKESDHPIAMAILLEGAGGGDVYAAPAANDILKWYFANR